MRLTSKILMAVILFTAVSASAQQPIPQGAMILMKTYPHFVKGYENGYLLMSDGTKLLYDDGREKTFLQKLDDSDPEDMFAFKYDRNSWTPEYLQDAGRSRCEPLFKKMYGASEAEVERASSVYLGLEERCCSPETTVPQTVFVLSPRNWSNTRNYIPI